LASLVYLILHVFSFSIRLTPSPFAICLYACCYRADVAKQRECLPKANNDLMFIYYVVLYTNPEKTGDLLRWTANILYSLYILGCKPVDCGYRSSCTFMFALYEKPWG